MFHIRRMATMHFISRATIGLLALTQIGCTSSDRETVQESELVPTTSLVEVRPTLPDESAPDWIGAVVNLHDLVVGDCFNRYSWSNDERLIEIDTKVECSGPHHGEVYLRTEHPAQAGAPWPGDREMEAFATAKCYGAFASFIGQIYELSELELGSLTPSRANFEDDVARFRSIHCYVYLEGDTELVGTARGSNR